MSFDTLALLGKHSQSVASNLNLNGVLEILLARTENVTDAMMATYGTMLDNNHKGMHVFNVDTGTQHYWNGSAWVSGVNTIEGSMIYKGPLANITAPPSDAKQGYVYVITTAGSLQSWIDNNGQTIPGDVTVQVGDQIVCRGETDPSTPANAHQKTWDILQSNLDKATTAVFGTVKLADMAAMIAKAGDQVPTADVVVAYVEGEFENKSVPSFKNFIIDVVKNTPKNIAHNMNLAAAGAASMVQFYDAQNNQMVIEHDIVDKDTLTVTSGLSMTGVKVAIVGLPDYS